MTVIRYQADLNKGVTRQTIRPAFLQGNAGAHKLEIFCVRGSEVVALIDEGVTAYFVRDDGRTVLIQGTVENGEACVVLPAACYAVEGSFELVVQVSGSGDNTSSIYWGGGMVRRSHTEELVDPGKVIPSLDELLAKIGLLEQTTARAEAVANLTAQAQTLPAGSEATASYANGKLTLGIPKGKDSETALPTGYKPFDMLVVGPDGAPRWEERTHYDYSGTVLPLSDLKVLGGHHTFDKPLDIMPVVGVPYRVSYQGTEYTVTSANATVETEVKGGRLIVKILGVDAANLDTTYTVTVTSGAESFTINANAFAYASAAVQSGSISPALKTLMHALYEYYAAASAYGA